jgi:hypothetical protein
MSGMSIWGDAGRDPVRRAYHGIGVARLVLIGVVFVLTGPPMTTLDDTAGRLLGTRWADAEPVPGINGPTTHLTVPAAPGSELEVTTTGADTTCAVRDGTGWTPLGRVEEAAGYDLSVGYREGRRGGPYLRTEEITRIHAFVAIGDRTELRCEGLAARRSDEVRRTDPWGLAGYHLVVTGGRVLWVAALSGVVWVPLLVRRRRRLRLAADEARRSEAGYRV